MTSGYLPPGRCIYCDAPEALTREHIIPAGIGGNWVLPAASCGSCAAKTSAAELHVMRVMLGDFRATAGVGSSRRKKPMTREAVRVADDGTTSAVPTPISALPAIYPSLEIPPPGLLTGAPTMDRYPEMKVVLCTVQADIGRRVQQLGRWQSQIMLEPTKFLAVIAKIAHSYAVAELGLDTFEYLLRDLILGNAQHPLELVGGADPSVSVPPAPGSLHLVSIYSRDDGYIVARVHLFAALGMRPYDAVVARQN